METKNPASTLTTRVIQMMDKKGFTDLFWSEWTTGNYDRHEDVYDALESEYYRVMGRRRYASFKSFRVRRDE